MMTRALLFALTMISGMSLAAQPVHPPGLLPTGIARQLLDKDPGVAAARAGLEVALQEAGILERSPYEWTARTTGQQRSVENAARYTEWNIGIERTIRLPGKAAADRMLGKAAVEESRARYGEALHEAARELITLWVEWLASERARELAALNLQSLQTSLTGVEKRLRAGDASKLDLSIAGAEMDDQRRVANDATTQASVAWARLSTRFPGIGREVLPLPTPLRIDADAAFWRERILTESDVLKVEQARMRAAQAHAERARADKTPDPTLGVFTASEIGGRERLAGLVISIPLAGGLRDSRHAKAIAAIDVSRHEIESRQRQLETQTAGAMAAARGAYESLRFAQEAAVTMQANAALMQRAYALGEAELQALLLARRQAIGAMNSALQAQVTALKAYYGLLVDAHLIWDLEFD